MSAFQILFAFSVVFTSVNGFIFGNAKWDGLKVTFGAPFSGNSFSSMPRTVHDANKDGFKKISGCDNSSPFRGERYVKDGDYAVVLLFDKNGFIAGIQAGVKVNGYPFKEITPPFIKDGDHYFITAYFTNPSTICSSGRSQSRFNSEGTGSELYIQNGPNPSHNVMKIPHEETALAGTKWTKGKCFPAMGCLHCKSHICIGMHYWHDLRTNTDCNSFLPVFLLYNGGKLNAFGWALIADLKSTRYEHPTESTFTAFMNEVPTCLKVAPKISTMHIYLTKNPALDLC